MTAPNAAPSPATKRRPAFLVRVVRRLWRLAVDPPYRNLTLLRFSRRRGVFQPFNDTRANRYPKVFSFVQARLGAESDVRILSYGCSTGEEVFSIREYFPRAIIKGIDINAANIAVCRRRLKQTRDAGITFEVANTTREEPTAAYDAIFCMAVFRHGDLGSPGVTRCDHRIRFEDFALALEDLKRCLKPGGLLAIVHSNFRLCDAPVGAAFETVLCVKFSDRAKKTPLFGPDNMLMAGVEYRDAVFRKK